MLRLVSVNFFGHILTHFWSYRFFFSDYSYLPTSHIDSVKITSLSFLCGNSSFLGHLMHRTLWSNAYFSIQFKTTDFLIRPWWLSGLGPYSQIQVGPEFVIRMIWSLLWSLLISTRYTYPHLYLPLDCDMMLWVTQVVKEIY